MASSPERVPLSRRTSGQQGGQLIEELEALSQALYQSQKKGFPYQQSQLYSQVQSQTKDTTTPSSKKQPVVSRRESLPARRFSSYEPSKDASAIPLPGLAASVDRRASTPTLRPRFSSSTLSSQPLPGSEAITEVRSRFLSPQPQRVKHHSSFTSDDPDWPDDAAEITSKVDSSTGEKKKSIWNWKPLRALSHIGRQRFHCVFSANVHVIKGLPPAMNGLRLCVHMRKEETKDGAVQTMPSRVFQGVAEFDETLFMKCTLYGSKGPSNTIKFMSKTVIVSVVATDVEELDLGKHQLDLSRLLPETMDERKGELDRGNSWDTTLELSGKAKGGKLMITFNYEVLDKESASSVSSKFRSSPPRRSSMQTSYSLPNSAHGTPRTRTARPHDFSPGGSEPGGEDFAMEHFNLDEPAPYEASYEVREQQSDVHHLTTSQPGNPAAASLSNGLSKIDPKSQGLHQHEGMAVGKEKSIGDASTEDYDVLVNEDGDNTFENEEFTVVDQGVEIDESVNSSAKDGPVEQLLDTNVDEGKVINKSQLQPLQNNEEREEKGKHDFDVHDGSSKEVAKKEIVTYQMVLKTLDSLLEGTSAKEQAHKDIFEAFSEFEKSQNEINVSKIGKEVEQDSKEKALPENLDHEADLVAGEFLHLLESEDKLLGQNSDSEPDSPRAQLLKQFEQEGLLDTEFGGDVNLPKVPKLSLDKTSLDILKSVSGESTGSAAKKVAAAVALKKTSLKLSEATETEPEWGLNKKIFMTSPSKHINKQQEPLPLGKGLSSVIPVKDGGILRSMSPVHFHASKGGGRLLLQVSKPVVLPAEMGAGTVDILRNMASMGIENMALQAMTAMPLEDLTGVSLEQISMEGLAASKSSRNRRKLQGYAWIRAKETSMNTQKQDSDISDELVSLEDLAPTAMLQIEALAIDGLKIQSHLTEEEAPYALNAFSIRSEGGISSDGKVGTLKGVTGVHLLKGAKVPAETAGGVKGLMDMAISLDEWLLLDSGLYDETESNKAILAAHRAIQQDLVLRNDNPTSRKARWGCMGNALTIAMRVQLRDPLRSYEAVGLPMIAFVQAERGVTPSKPTGGGAVSEKGLSKEEDAASQSAPLFKIMGVHMAGLKASQNNKKPAWGSQRQLQTGSRWLIANGMSKSSHADAFVKPKSSVKAKHGDSLWSISAQVHGSGNKWKDLMKLNPHIRNPDVVYDKLQ